jgi:hypothetical protein
MKGNKKKKKKALPCDICVRKDQASPAAHGPKTQEKTSYITVLLSIIQPTYYVKNAVLRIQDVYPGTLIRIFSSRIQGQKGTGSRIPIRNYFFKAFLTQITVIALLEMLSGMFIADARSGFFSIPDPGVKTAPDPRSGPATLKK